MPKLRRLALALVPLLAAPALAQEDFASWPPLQPRFESTGGGGVMIGEYEPVVLADRCVTRFTATEPNGTVYRNIVMFDAVPMQGGIPCQNGRWRSLDSEATGTTPFRVFWKDGVARRAP